MSNQAISATLALDPAEVTKEERLYLLVVANYADHEGVAWPSNARVARESSLSETAVKRAVRSCEEKGLVARLVNGAPDERISGDRRPNRIDLLYLGRGAMSGPRTNATGGHERADGGPLVNGRGAMSGPQTLIEPLVNPQTRARADSLVADEFASWYAGYPLKRDRSSAEKAYRRARKNTTAAVLLRVRDNYVADAEQHKRLLKHPATLLNGWEDWVEVDAAEEADDMSEGEREIARAWNR